MPSNSEKAFSRQIRRLGWLSVLGLGSMASVHGFSPLQQPLSPARTAISPPSSQVIRPLGRSDLTRRPVATLGDNDFERRRPGWQFWRRRRSRKDDKLASKQLQMMAKATEEAVETQRISPDDASLLLKTFEQSILKQKLRQDEQSRKVFLKASRATRGAAASVVRMYAENFLRGMIHRRSVVPPSELSVDVAPQGHVLLALVRGFVGATARISFDRVIFPCIQLSGGTLEAERVVLNLWSFTLENLRPSAVKFPKQFRFHAKDCVLTQDDLLQSNCIRNGLRRLLVRVLGKVGVKTSKAEITSIQILNNGKISVRGQALLPIGGKVPFEVRTGIDTTSRGHIVTFPGLEVSVNPSLGVFIPILPTLDLDIGHNAEIRAIELDGKQKLLRLSASATITPEHTIKLGHQYQQSNDAFLATFSFDVGRWLTRIGNFSK